MMEVTTKYAKAAVFVLIAMVVFVSNTNATNALSESRDPNPIGYEFLDNQTVLHMWNLVEDYYFDIGNNCYAQMTNHYDSYWSHNTFGFGIQVYGQWYYYESDKFCDWQFEIETDNETYVRFELSESMKIYPQAKISLFVVNELELVDPRLNMEFSMRHNGGYEITDSRFRWHIDNIKINMVEENNFIMVEGEDYDLSDELDIEFDNLPYGYFQIYDNVSGEFISMNWESASYDDIVTVKSYESESYNAPVSLIANLGSINYGETKYFKAQWIDRSKECPHPFTVHMNNPPDDSEYLINETFDMQGHWHAFPNPWSSCTNRHGTIGQVRVNGTGVWQLINSYVANGVLLNSSAMPPYMYWNTMENFPSTSHSVNPSMDGNLICKEEGTHQIRYGVFHSQYGYYYSGIREVTCSSPEEPEEEIEGYQLAILLSLFAPGIFFILWASKLDDDHIPLKIAFMAFAILLFVSTFHIASLMTVFEIGGFYVGMLYLALASGFIGAVLWLKKLLTTVNAHL